MPDNEKTWRSIGSIVDEIVRLKIDLHQVIDPADQDDRDEALDILNRIERKIKARGIKRS